MPIPAAFVAATLIALLPQVSALVPAPSPNAQRNNGFEQAIYRRASPDETRAFVADSFRTMDKDGSHFIERVEAPESGLIEGPGGRVGDPVQATAPITIIHNRTGQAMWIATFDTDADGRVSEPEFTRIQVPTFLRLGVPSNWRGVKAAAATETAAQR